MMVDLGPLPPAPTEERRWLGASTIPTTYGVFKPHIATLPDGSVVALPEGTIIRPAKEPV